MSEVSMEIIAVAENDIAPLKLSKQEIWWRIQHMKRAAEAKGMAVAISGKVVAEFGPVAAQAREQ